MDAMIFDFDGVLVDSEPIHLAAFREVLTEEDIELTEAAYYDRYLGYDDHDCFAAVAEDFSRSWSEQRIDALTQAKTAIVQRMLRDSVTALPGAVELIQAAAEAGVPMAICSGALGDEVRLATKAIGVLDAMTVVVAADDVDRGKPDPEGYLKAAALLGKQHSKDIRAGGCVVCEDSPAGIVAAKAAGMTVLALTTSYPADRLSQADRIVENLAAVTLADLQQLSPQSR